jgi:spore maturation protein CgeB
VCFRDYEAAAAGCLLVKPDMGHLRTSPNIFRDGETYVSVRWDLADLGEKIRHYLTKPAEGERIASEGAAVLREYASAGGFARDVASALEGIVPTLPATGRVANRSAA